MPIGFGHYSGELAIDIGPQSQLSDIGLPWRKNAITNARFRDMVENEYVVRMPIYKLDGLGKMLFKYQDVVCEIEPFKLCDAAIEIISQHELIIRFIVNRMTYCFHLGESGNSLEL